MQGTQTASLDTQKPLVYVSLIVVSSAIPFDNFTGMPDKEPRAFHHCVACCAIGVSFHIFPVTKTFRNELVALVYPMPNSHCNCVHARPLGYLDAPYLFRAHALCMCT